MGRPTAGIAWRPHSVGEKFYELDHLHPYDRELVIASKGDYPERRFQIHISFGLHCFTRKPDPGERDPLAGWYSDSRETRVFCPERWEVSKQLPDIIDSLGQRKCFHTKGEEFVTLKMVHGGRKFEYAVFFTVSKARKNEADLNLFVNSAHERHDPLKHNKPVRFNLILMNRYQGKPIKRPR